MKTITVVPVKVAADMKLEQSIQPLKKALEELEVNRTIMHMSLRGN